MLVKLRTSGIPRLAQFRGTLATRFRESRLVLAILHHSCAPATGDLTGVANRSRVSRLAGHLRLRFAGPIGCQPFVFILDLGLQRVINSRSEAMV